MSDSAIGVENIITVRMNARTDLAALYTWNTESVARVIQAIWAKELRPTLQQSSIARVGVICALRDGGCAVAPHDPLWLLQGAWTLGAAVRATNVFFKKWCDDSVPELDEEEIKERIDEHGEYIRNAKRNSTIQPSLRPAYPCHPWCSTCRNALRCTGTPPLEWPVLCAQVSYKWDSFWQGPGASGRNKCD